MDEPLKLGFVGLGAMGLPMASNMISKAAQGSTLYVYDVSEGPMKTLADAHPGLVVVCDSPREVSRSTVSGQTLLVHGRDFSYHLPTNGWYLLQ